MPKLDHAQLANRLRRTAGRHLRARVRALAPAVLLGALSLAAALTLTLTLQPTPITHAQTDIFISEYIEGSSNNKALEFFNGTGSAINLATGGYVVEYYFNGAATTGNTINLTGTIPAGGTYVLANSNSVAAILAVANQTDGGSWYNGDDAIVLRKTGNVIVDSLGQVGFDPGTEWGTGDQSTADNTLRRKATICQGDTNIGDVFDPVLEWDGFPQDTFGGLGSHSVNCGGPTSPAPTPTSAPAPALAAAGAPPAAVREPKSGFQGTVVVADITTNATGIGVPNVVVPSANDPCINGLLDFTVSLQNVGARPVVDNPAFPELRIMMDDGFAIIACTASVGTCTFSGGIGQVNFNLPVSATVTVSWTIRFVGGVDPAEGQTAANNMFNVQTCAIWDFNGNGVIDAAESDCNNGTPPAQASIAKVYLFCQQVADPNRQLGNQVHLPILNYLGQDNVCTTWIEIQHIGCEPAKAALVVWGAPGFCPPQAAGPLKVECTGLLKPGSSWTMLGAQIPSGAKSGILFKFTARQLKEIGVDLGFDDVTADYMCETLFNGVVGNNDDYRRFKKAYNEGLEYAGIPMDLAAGGGFLAVDVLRKCPGDVTPTALVTSMYDGIAGSHLGTYDEDFGGFGYYVPLAYSDQAGFNTTLYLQNGGLECSSIEVWFKAQDDCLRSILCDVMTLAPGESFQLDASDCAGPGWQGSAWVRSSAPLGIAVDLVGRDVLMTYIGEPAELNDTFDPALASTGAADQVLFGPLVYSEYQGWDSGVQVMNMSGVVDAKVKVYFLDRSGDIVTTLVDWICPRGSQTFFLPVISNLPGTWVGSIRVESQAWWTPGSIVVQSPNIDGVALLTQYSDATRTDTRQGIAYNLLPEHKIYDWQIGSAGGGTDSGVALVAIPSMLKDTTGNGVNSELSVANIVPKPGFTDFAIFLYDQNGLIDYVCQKLNEKQVEYIDLVTWGYVNPRFKGSAIISATFWEHDVFDADGHFLRNLVGLGAVVVERTGTLLGEDIPGDEAAGDRGIPFRMPDIDAQLCPLALTANKVPLCPGLPETRTASDCTKSRFVAKCTDCPKDIADGSVVGTQSLINVNLPKGCDIKDVDVWLSLEHVDIEDLSRVAVTSPRGTSVELFSTICAGTVAGHVNAIFDDDATERIGISPGTCPAEHFDRLNIENPATLPNLTSFEGENPNGTWQLFMRDSVNSRVGKLLYWELQFELK